MSESEAGVSAWADTTTAGIFVIKGNRLAYVNSAGQAMTGYTQAELLAMNFWDPVHPEFQELVRERGMARQRREPVTPRLEFKIVTKKGQERWVDSTAIEITHEGETAILATILDTTDRRETENALTQARDKLRELVAERTRNLMAVNEQLRAGIAEREKVEAALRETEKRYRALAENSAVGFWQVTPNLSTIYLNPAMRRMLEIDTRKELEGMSYRSFVAPESLEAFEREQAKRYGGVASTYEIDLIGKRGGRRTVLISGAPLMGPNGEVESQIGTLTDITQQKRVEEELRQSRQQLQAILNNTLAVVYVKDLQGRFLFVNRRFETLVNVAQGEALGKTDYDLFPEEEAAVFQANDREVSRVGQPVEFEERALHDDGVHTYISLKFPLHDVAGATYAVCGISTDITERKRAEKAVGESEAKYRRLVETAHDLIWSVDPEGRVTFVNRQWLEVLGYRQKEMVGHFFTEFLPAEDIERTKAVVNDALAGKGYTNHENAVLTKDGRAVVFNFNGTALRDGDGNVTGVMGTAQDVTERRKTDALKEEFSQRLLQTLEDERRRIARDLHDDVGQLLAALGLQLNALSRGGRGTVEVDRRLLRDINARLTEATDSVANLVRNYHPTELNDLGFAEALRSFVGEFAKRLGLGLALKVDFVDPLLDEDEQLHLYRIVQEALSNVAKHARASHVSVCVTRERDGLRAVVEDDGQGFESRGSGNRPRGFGLITMRERAAMLHGEFAVHSENHRGTTIEVTVPLRSPRC